MIRKTLLCATLMMSTISVFAVSAEDTESNTIGFVSAQSVEGTLEATSKEQDGGFLSAFRAHKAQLEESMGLSYGFDNFTHYLSSNSNNDPSDAATNVFRLYGTWTTLGRGTLNDGALVFKVENRSAIGNKISTQSLGPTLGYGGTFASTYSDAGWVLTNFYWRQRFAEGRGSFVIGQVDNYDYVNVNALASPWTAFTNLAFEHQSTYPGPSQGLGAAVRWHLNDNWAVLGGFTDANAVPHNPVSSAKRLFNTGETFQHIALGWTPEMDSAMDQLWQLTLWHMDEREDAGVQEGHGVSFAGSLRMGQWRSFLRAGYANDGGSILERAVSMAVGYDARGGKDLVGIGVDWGRAAHNSRDQYTMEAFYRYDITDFMQLTPSIQYIINPVNDDQTDDIFVAGVRLRFYF